MLGFTMTTYLLRPARHAEGTRNPGGVEVDQVRILLASEHGSRSASGLRIRARKREGGRKRDDQNASAVYGAGQVFEDHHDTIMIMMIMMDLVLKWICEQGICAPENWGRDRGGSSRKSAAHAETVANLAGL